MTHSDSHNGTRAAKPLVADTVSPQTPEADNHSATNGDGPRDADKSTDEPARGRSKSTRRANRRRSKNKPSEEKRPSEPESIATRLLKEVEFPAARLDRKLVPPPLLDALDAAGLGNEANLPAATFMALAAVGAVAGSSVRVENAGGLPPPANLAIRVALVTPDDRLSLIPPALMAGAHGVEADRIEAYTAAAERNASLRRDIERRKRLYEQTRQNAAALGIETPAPAPDGIPPALGPRPLLVVMKGGSRAVQAAAAGGTGLLVVDERHVASMANVAGHYDTTIDRLLNAAAAGHSVAIEDRNSGCVAMRPLTASVIGVLTLAGCATAYKAGWAQLASTVFVNAAVPPVAADSAPLMALMRAVASIKPTSLRLPAPGAISVWSSAANVQPPLSDFLAQRTDLTLRLAAVLHIVALADGRRKLAPNVPVGTVRRAAAIVESYVTPLAEAVLGPVSVDQVERDGRRVVAYAREWTSLTNPVLERRTLMRAWQRSMPVRQLDAALALLVHEGLLAPLDEADPGVMGQQFRVAPAAFEGA